MLNLKIFTNKVHEDEKALVNLDTDEVVLKGDYYHDHIIQLIEGFQLGLSIANVECIIKTEDINQENKYFAICDFGD